MLPHVRCETSLVLVFRKRWVSCWVINNRIWITFCGTYQTMSDWLRKCCPEEETANHRRKLNSNNMERNKKPNSCKDKYEDKNLPSRLLLQVGQWAKILSEYNFQRCIIIKLFPLLLRYHLRKIFYLVK